MFLSQLLYPFAMLALALQCVSAVNAPKRSMLTSPDTVAATQPPSPRPYVYQRTASEEYNAYNNIDTGAPSQARLNDSFKESGSKTSQIKGVVSRLFGRGKK